MILKIYYYLNLSAVQTQTNSYYCIIIVMFSKVWDYITNMIGLNSGRNLMMLQKKQKKQRFLIIEDPYVQTKPKQKLGESRYKMPHNSIELANIYKLQQQLTDDDDSKNHNEKQRREPQDRKETDDFIQNMKQIDEISKSIQKLNNQLEQFNKKTKISVKVNQINVALQNINKAQQKQRQLYKKYIRVVSDVMSSKYSGQLTDYPSLSYEEFRQIIQYWRASQSNLSLVDGYRFLHHSSMYYLKDSGWLNDQILTQYINFMNQKLSQRHSNSYYIIDSVKSQTIFAKTDYAKIQKILQKNKVSRKTNIIIAINKKKQRHWIFLKMQRQNIFIYDSITTSVQKSLQQPLISNIHKFATSYYGSSPDISVVSNFPKQNNGYDCGMMMLCGIKDVVRDRSVWSFGQKEIPYKRYLMTKQIRDKSITGFQNY